MNPAEMITLIIALTCLVCAMPALGAWLYWRGTTRANPIPTVKNPLKRDKKPPEPVVHLPPVFPCPHCTKTKSYVLSTDKSKWICNACKGVIPGPIH